MSAMFQSKKDSIPKSRSREISRSYNKEASVRGKHDIQQCTNNTNNILLLKTYYLVIRFILFSSDSICNYTAL